MLHADIVVLHSLCLAGCGVEHLIGGLRDIDLVGSRKLFGHGGRKAAGVHIQLLQQLRDQALLLRSEGMQQMFRFQLIVLVLHSQLLRCLQSLQRFLCILIGIHKVKPPFIPEGLF